MERNVYKEKTKRSEIEIAEYREAPAPFPAHQPQKTLLVLHLLLPMAKSTDPTLERLNLTLAWDRTGEKRKKKLQTTTLGYDAGHAIQGYLDKAFE